MVRSELVPWVLERAALDGDVLEVGPGYGATTQVLVGMVPQLVAVEVDADLATRLAQRVDGPVHVVCGDGAELPFADDSFDRVVCFTMLHHVPSAATQDRLFAEAHRVLRPDGVFAGSDSRPDLRFRLIHLLDTMVPVDPSALPGRLAAAGFADIRVDTTARRLRFAARSTDHGGPRGRSRHGGDNRPRGR